MTGLCSMHLKMWQLSLPWVIDFSKDHLFLVHSFLTVQVNWTDSPTCTILQWEVVVWLQWIGANSWGSLAFREIFLFVTISTSCNQACNMLAMTRGINSYPLYAFMIFMSHCFSADITFSWTSVTFSWFFGGWVCGKGEVKVVAPVNHFIAFSYSVGPVTVKYSSLRVRKYFHNLLRKCY